MAVKSVLPPLWEVPEEFRNRLGEQAAHGHRMALSAHRLNLLVAFFFPIATLSAIFGVNLAHGYEQQFAPLPFLGVLLLGLGAGLLLKSFVTKP